MKVPPRLHKTAHWVWRGALVSLFFASCHGPQAYLSSDASPWLSYERTMCFGSCPAFRLEVQSDGSVFFNGRAHTQPLGKHRTLWSTGDLSRLAQAAADLRLDKKAGTYDNPMIMDLPSTRLHFGGYHVLDRIDGPNLKPLYTLLDSLIAASDWAPEPR